MCFDGSSEFLIVAANDGKTKHSFKAAMNRKATISRAAHLQNGYYVASTYEQASAVCSVTNPVACSKGVSVSLWAMVDDALTDSSGDATGNVVHSLHTLLNSGPPHYAGL